MEKKITKVIIILIAVILIAAGGVFVYASMEDSKINDWAHSIFYGDVRVENRVVYVTTHVKNETEALKYIKETTAKMQQTDLYKKYPGLVITVTINDGNGELIQGYDGELVEFMGINLDRVKGFDSFLTLLH